MNMWNWLHDCYDEKSLTIEDLEEIMENDQEAEKLWRDWADQSNCFIDFVRDEIKPFITYIKQKK
jgi:hypothetical protein